MPTVESQTIQLRNNSRTTCIAEPKQLKLCNVTTCIRGKTGGWEKTGGRRHGPSLEPRPVIIGLIIASSTFLVHLLMQRDRIRSTDVLTQYLVK